ncbi:MAG: BCD family MFS transporter [Steroidobacteraceae bacterium]
MTVPTSNEAALRWPGIFRLGLVQAALGAVVVLVTSTLNRVMVVEYALPALLPGVLVSLHYAVQLVRPRFGFGSDRGGRRTPWIIGGMAVLSAGGVLCSIATVLLHSHAGLGLALAIVGYAMVGIGVGAAGTSLLVLMASRVDDHRRAAAATIMWILMIAGFAVTSGVVGRFLDPFSPRRLIQVTGIAAAAAFLIALTAVWNVERAGRPAPREAAPRAADGNGSFAAALERVWRDPPTRAFTLFVFVSMLAYSAQELLLEPFSGLVFGYTLGGSAKLSGSWHGSALFGMIGVGMLCSGRRRFGSLRQWTVGGCCASAAALASLGFASMVGPAWPLQLSVLVLGVSNGVFAVSAIGSMMELAHDGESGNAGVRMGLWGAAQAIAFAFGGVLGTAIVDSFRWLFGSPTAAFAVVFYVEAVLFLAAAVLAAKARSDRRFSPPTSSAVIA